MKAHALIASGTFDPATLATLRKAFDDAWEQVAPLVSKRGGAIEAARLRLAGIVLGLAKDGGTQDPQALTNTAVHLMLGGATKL